MIRDKQGKFVKGFTHSEESKKKMSKARIGNQYSKGFKYDKSIYAERKQNMIGHKVSKETRLKISNALKGKIPSQHVFDALKQYYLTCNIKKSDTKPERRLQLALLLEEVKFTTQKHIIGRPDIFIEPNICIFVDGDYWHTLPKQIKRDIEVNDRLEKDGYQVLRFWEHEIYESLRFVIDRILMANG